MPHPEKEPLEGRQGCALKRCVSLAFMQPQFAHAGSFAADLEGSKITVVQPTRVLVACSTMQIGQGSLAMRAYSSGC
jgi:hypothetical protein